MTVPSAPAINEATNWPANTSVVKTPADLLRAALATSAISQLFWLGIVAPRPSPASNVPATICENPVAVAMTP